MFNESDPLIVNASVIIIISYPPQALNLLRVTEIDFYMYSYFDRKQKF